MEVIKYWGLTEDEGVVMDGDVLIDLRGMGRIAEGVTELARYQTIDFMRRWLEDRERNVPPSHIETSWGWN